MIEAMKQALEALELSLRSHGVMLLSDPPQDAWKTYGVESNARKAIASLRQAIAEEALRNVARLGQEIEQEPVAVVSGYYGGQCVVLPTNPTRLFNSGTAFFTHPPKREPLTDDEFTTCIETNGIPVEDVELVWAIKDLVEAAHGIKENT